MTMEGLGIHKAICAIKLALAGGGGITKDRRAPMGYSFRGIEDFDNILCGLTAEHQLNAYPRILSKEMLHGTTSKGSYQSHVIVEIEWTYVCASDGSRQIATTVGEAMDTQDKAYNKAMQASRKYADIMVFRIPVAGDDSEIYVPAHSAPERPPPPPVAPPVPVAPVHVTNGELVQSQPEPVIKRTRGPNKPNRPNRPPAIAEAPVVVPEPVLVPEPDPEPERNIYADESHDTTTVLMGRIGEVQSFPLLYAMAQDADAHLEPGRTELFGAIKNRAVWLFIDTKSMAEVQEGFPLVAALGQPLELKKAANEAYARFRQQS